MMQPFPHRYEVSAGATATGEVTLVSGSNPAMKSAAPAEFGGPGDRWSPETLLVGAVADCFILTFRALADSSQVPWTSLRCDAVGTVDRIERVTRFSEIILRARLQVPDGTDQEKARRVLEKAERSCLISNSLSVPVHLEADIHMARTAA